MLVQVGIITPLALVVNLIMRLEPPKWLREGSVAAMTCAIGCTYLYLQQGKGPVTVAFSLVGAIVTAMFASVVMRLRFFYALAASGTILAASLWFLFVEARRRRREDGGGEPDDDCDLHYDDVELQPGARRASWLPEVSGEREPEPSRFRRRMRAWSGSRRSTT